MTIHVLCQNITEKKYDIAFTDKEEPFNKMNAKNILLNFSSPSFLYAFTLKLHPITADCLNRRNSEAR